MSNVKKIYYREIDPDIYDVSRALKRNRDYIIGVGTKISDDAILDIESDEMDRYNIRNKIIAEDIKNGIRRPRLASSTFDISTIKNKVVLIAKY